MTKIGKALAKFNLGRVATQLEEAAKDSIRLAAAEPCKEAVSRLGGRPNLPRDVEWPESKEGPLAFVAQLDLGSMPRIREFGLPLAGSLFFFYSGNDSPTKPADRKMFRVLYIDSALDGIRERSFPKELDSKLRWQGFRFEAQKEVSFPWPEDTIVRQLNLSKDESGSFWEFSSYWLEQQSQLRTLHRVGGYPNYVQHDPKFEAHLKTTGLWAEIWKKGKLDAMAYFQETNRRFAEARQREGHRAAEWELLLQVDSEEANGMMWGDAGHLYFLMRRDDLQARRWEKAWMIWDCY